MKQDERDAATATNAAVAADTADDAAAAANDAADDAAAAISLSSSTIAFEV